MIYMKAGEIKGTSEDSFHEGWIPLESFDFNVNFKSSVLGVDEEDGKESDQKPVISSVKIKKQIDASAPALMKWMFEGAMVDEATIEICKEDGYAYMRYTLTKAYLMNYEVSVNEKVGTSVLLEVVFQEMTVETMTWTVDNEYVYPGRVKIKRS